MFARERRLKRRMGIPAELVLRCWALAEYRGMQVPDPPLPGVRYTPPYLALTDGALWLTRAGATRRYPVEDIVMVATEHPATDRIRVDFMEGEPLLIRVNDGGRFASTVEAAIQEYDKRLQLDATSALGLPEPAPELVAKAKQARTRSDQLMAAAGGDQVARRAAEGHLAEERALWHEAQVDALRQLRRALWATQVGAESGNRRNAHDLGLPCPGQRPRGSTHSSE